MFDHHCKSARTIAEALSAEEGGTMISFEVPGGRNGAFRFLNALKIVDISNNLGDTKSLITHPATTTHQRLKPEDRQAMGISDGLVRISVGREDVDDIREDLEQAIKKAGK